MDNGENWFLSALSAAGSLITIVWFAMYVAERKTGLPEMPRLTRLSVLLQLGILSAGAQGTLWSLTELVFHLSYGAGGTAELPQGWSAVALSLTLTIPLALVPIAYEKVTGQVVLLPKHRAAVPGLLLLGVGAHLVVYGFSPNSFVGVSKLIAEPLGPTTLGSAFARELAYSVTFFVAMVVPYRLFVRLPSPRLALDLLLGRTLLPVATYVLVMVVFITLRYPDSLNEHSWVQVRGVLAGLVLNCCLCAGMFV